MNWAWWLLGVVVCAPSASASVYKYVDEQGTLSYTDDLALAAPFKPEELEYLDPDPDKVRLRYTANGNLFIINELHGPVTVTLQLSQQEGVRSSRDLHEPIVVAARSEEFVDTLHYSGHGQLEISQHFIIGMPSQVQDSELQLPFRGRFRVSQGFEGSYSHHLPGNRYAIDVPMPEGTPVLAARQGVVLDMKMGFTGNSQDPRSRAQTNYIRLLHPDGTMTVYAHLRTGTARVTPGQSVQVGDMLAESGNTGYSTAPHLHFAVQRNDGQRLVSIPFHIRGQVPTQGNWLGD
jgi:murein DD-endopeptidase MepM/ murein hydrolase activator NlpD